MLKLTKARFLPLLLAGALGTVACGDEGTPSDTPIVNTFEAGAMTPPVSTPVPDAGSSMAPPTMVPPTNNTMDASRPNNMMMPPANTDTGVAPVPGDAGTPVDSGMSSDGGGSVGGDGGAAGEGMCCPDGKCVCHGDVPAALTNRNGPFKTASYTVSAGCIYYPTDAKPPFAAVAVSDGFLGAGGCGSFQTGQWGPLYASWGIVAMIVNTGSSDQPAQRATALANGISAFKSENMKSGSPLMGKLAGRYGTSGFSMGGGGTTIAAQRDKTLLSDVAIMPWGPTNSGVTVPTLVICGSSDGTAPCAQHGTPAYNGIADSVPKMRIQINSGHAGQPSSGGGVSGQVGLAFQKVFLEGDTRWRPLLVKAMSVATNIK